MKLNNSNGSSNDDSLDRINESCNCCKRHFTKVIDIRVGILDDQYYCSICAKELNIKITVCRDI